jgi:hypothetical protein
VKKPKAAPTLRSKLMKWDRLEARWGVRMEFMIAFYLAMALVSRGVGRGMLLGYSLFWLMNLGTERLKRRRHKDNVRALFVLDDILQRTDGYKLVHHMEKALCN